MTVQGVASARVGVLTIRRDDQGNPRQLTVTLLDEDGTLLGYRTREVGPFDDLWPVIDDLRQGTPTEIPLW